MIKRRTLFEYDFKPDSRKALIKNHEIVSMFRTNIAKGKSIDSVLSKQYFKKIGKALEDIPIYLRLMGEFSGEKIDSINDEDAIVKALRAIKQHRKIGNNIYKTLEIDATVIGETLIAFDGKPSYIVISQEALGSYAHNFMTFKSYEGQNAFKHNPDLDSKKIEIELLVESRKKGELFVKMYDAVLKQYKDAGMEMLVQENNSSLSKS
jgi:hypothetical protein